MNPWIQHEEENLEIRGRRMMSANQNLFQHLCFDTIYLVSKYFFLKLWNASSKNQQYEVSFYMKISYNHWKLVIPIFIYYGWITTLDFKPKNICTSKLEWDQCNSTKRFYTQSATKISSSQEALSSF